MCTGKARNSSRRAKCSNLSVVQMGRSNLSLRSEVMRNTAGLSAACTPCLITVSS